MTNDEYAGSLQVSPDQVPDPQIDAANNGEGKAVAVLAGGCFWCVEAVFKSLQGVHKVCSGYAGDNQENANYHDVCTGTTRHAEAVEIQFDPAIISYGQILKYFFSIAHDPTQENHQGNDAGTQYRSTIFYLDDEQRRIAGAYIEQLNLAKVFNAPLKTTLEPLRHFYTAEDYHQDYAARNPGQPYVAYTAAPKVAKLQRYFANRLK